MMAYYIVHTALLEGTELYTTPQQNANDGINSTF